MALLDTVTKWWTDRVTRREPGFMDAEEFQALARDVGFSADQLARLTAQGAKGAEDLPRLMVALGLAPERARRSHPAVMRDMSIVCSGCLLKRRCRNDIKRGWAPVVQRYCPNTLTIKSLYRERYEMMAPHGPR